MNRMKSLCLVSALVGLVAACGGAAGDYDASGSASGSGGAGTSTGEAGGWQYDGGGMCDPPPPPSPTLPDQMGCYVNMGSGWVEVPCSCDLWMENTTPSPSTARIQLIVTPQDEVPTLNGELDVEVAFEDPDASWYATWSKQPGDGEAFTIANEKGTTTVRMGESGVALGPVPLAPCETRKAVARVSPWNTSAVLSMHATLDDGTEFAATDALCSNPPPF